MARNGHIAGRNTAIHLLLEPTYPGTIQELLLWFDAGTKFSKEINIVYA